jgi:hypothetical protein
MHLLMVPIYLSLQHDFFSFNRLLHAALVITTSLKFEIATDIGDFETGLLHLDFDNYFFVACISMAKKVYAFFNKSLSQMSC